MKRILMFVMAGMLLSACGAPKSDAIEVTDFWARSGMKDGNGAAYMLITNGTAQDDELIGASSDVANAVEIHLSQMGADGVMQMIKQESVAIDSGEALELKPGSYHVMLIGLKQDLKVGESITLTLHFKTYEDITIDNPCTGCRRYGRFWHGYDAVEIYNFSHFYHLVAFRGEMVFFCGKCFECGEFILFVSGVGEREAVSYIYNWIIFGVFSYLTLNYFLYCDKSYNKFSNLILY